MDTAAREAKVRAIDYDVELCNKTFDEIADEMEECAACFREERRDALQDIRRQTKRPVSTQLVLRVYQRKNRKLRVPCAEWRHITAKGKKVDRAQATIASRAGRQAIAPQGRGRMSIFSEAISKNRKYGYRIQDLLKYAHPSEIELVKDVEAALEKLRKRAASLSTSGTRLLQARYQHARMLEGPFEHERKVAPLESRRTAPSSERVIGMDAPDETNAKPQLRQPR